MKIIECHAEGLEIFKLLSGDSGHQLFRAVRRLSQEGRSVIFISHKLGEVLEITDRITVIRDGHVVGTVPTKEATHRELAHMMVGRPVMMAKTEIKAIMVLILLRKT